MSDTSLPASSSPQPICGAVHQETGAECELPTGHQQNHRGVFDHGIVQWPPASSSPWSAELEEIASALWCALCEGEGEHSERLDKAVIVTHIGRVVDRLRLHVEQTHTAEIERLKVTIDALRKEAEHLSFTHTHQQRRELETALSTAHQGIESFWLEVERGYDIEPRAYFEKEAVPMGFSSPVAMAVHHMWKRDVKERDGQTIIGAVQLDGLRAELVAAHQEIADAHGYLSGLFKFCAPQCEPQAELLGVVTQIDNYIGGLRASLAHVEGERDGYTLTERRLQEALDELDTLRKRIAQMEG